MTMGTIKDYSTGLYESGDDLHSIRGALRVIHPKGQSFFVDRSVSSSGDGKSWSTAKKTIDEAISLATANAGDRIYIAAGAYDENAAAAGVAVDVAGVSIIGVSGRVEVTVENSHSSATAVFTVSASSVEIYNLTINETTSTVIGIDITNNYVHIHDVSTTGALSISVRIGAYTHCRVYDCYFGSPTNGVVLLDGSTSAIVYDNTFYAVATNAIDIQTSSTAGKHFIYRNIINGDNSATDVGINVASARNTVVWNSVAECATLISATTANNEIHSNFKIDVRGEHAVAAGDDPTNPAVEGPTTVLSVSVGKYGGRAKLLNLVVDLKKATTGFEAVATASDTIKFWVEVAIDGTNYRRVGEMKTYTAGSIDAADANTGHPITDMLDFGEDYRVRFKVSQDRGAFNLPFSYVLEG